MPKPTLMFSLPALRIQQRQEPNQGIYIAVVRADEFFVRESERFLVDYYRRDGGNEDGYQRTLAPSAVEKIKDYILKEVRFPLLPTSLLVNARDPLEFKQEKGSYGQLVIEQPLYVIDGQHRFEAWKSLMHDEKLKNEFGDFEFPVVVLSNFNKIKEIEQFYVINSRQKRIKTDLAQRNFLRLAGHKTTESLVPERSRWTLHATKIVDVLNEQISDSVWKEKIVLPNDGLDLRKRKIISQASFVSSLKPFFIGRDAIFKVEAEKNGEERPAIEAWAKLLNNYWKVIAKIYPEAVNNMHDYSLMKTVGVFSMHQLFTKVASQRDNEGSILDNTVQASVLKDLEKLISQAKDKSFKLDFWRSKVSDIKKERGDFAGAYSSSVGHNKIVSKIMLGY